MDQIELHNKIDLLVQKDPAHEKAVNIRALISVNQDAYSYFFAKANENWLTWLWENGFLDVIKQKAEDPTRYGYKTPELNYIVKISAKESIKVVNIMLAVPISTENFNPEVVDRFLRICSGLPAQELKQIVTKIRDEKWPQLMNVFNEWGFEYEKMLKTLAEADDFGSILILAEAILAVRIKKEAEQTSRGLSFDNPFYFKNLSYTKVFEYLLKVDEKNIEKALALVTDAMRRIILLGEEGEDKIFKVYDRYFLLDVDFFTLILKEKGGLSSGDDVENLAAIIKNYAERTIGGKCYNAESVAKLYGAYFESLPDSRSMWRLRLFVMSLCPEALKQELKKAFFRLFEVENYHELISGTEYQKALHAGFSVLSETDKREYVKQVIEYFMKKDQEDKKENWHMVYGSKILSVIADYLIENEKQEAKSKGFTIDPAYAPEPSIGPIRSGSIVPRGPITKEEFSDLPIADIAKKLRNEWTPKKLTEQDINDDFFNPLNAEGVGELLRTDIAKRLQDYINNAHLFFERDVLDQHYTYSYLRGTQEVIRGNKADVNNINWDNLITLCTAIKKSGEVKPFSDEKRERNTFNAWLSDWRGVHSVMTDVLQELLNEERDKIIVDFSKYRSDLFSIISYLLVYPDPEPRDEQIETAGMKTKSPGSDEYSVSDPFSMAINTVRGRAFQVFVLFVYQDGKKFTKEEKVKISLDTKNLYETVLKNERTRALMFMFGHYLPSFYFRNKEWIQGLLPQIFPTEQEKRHLYTAAWEGYVSTSLYEDVFFNPDIQKLYERGLALTDADYPKQKHFKEPDEGVAVHIALAFMHFLGFGFDHTLFKKFWSIPNSKNHKEFISFIGRHSISRESAAEWVKHNKVDIEKLKKFWDWALENCNSEELTGFGFWIKTEQSPLCIKWLAKHTRQTLEETKGYVEWEYGLMRSLTAFAKEAPEDTLVILRFHLLEEVAKHEPVRTWLHVDNEVYDAFKEIYKNKTTKEGVRILINDLLPYRNGLFWGLKPILEEGEQKI
ncbi:MAG: hypothetical protein ABII89_06645 [Candidatus Omnitrophota bacterium]